jgi:HSP20 family protein
MPWDPTRDLLTMQERLESLFGGATTGWVPAMDLVEHDDHYLVTVELPGLSRADVHIDATEKSITVRGKRPGQECCPERYQQLERGQGDFSRSLHFPNPVAAAGIAADLSAGVLTVVVPKLVVRRQIDVE